eukprot:UN26929
MRDNRLASNVSNLTIGGAEDERSKIVTVVTGEKRSLTPRSSDSDKEAPLIKGTADNNSNSTIEQDMISHLHHQLGQLKEYWKDDLDELEKLVKDFENLIEEKLNTIHADIPKGQAKKDLEEFQLDTHETFVAIYDVLKRNNRGFPTVERTNDSDPERLRHDRDNWKEKAMDLLKRGYSADGPVKLDKLDENASKDKQVETIQKQITQTLDNA